MCGREPEEATVKRQRLRVEARGDGDPPLLLLHGFTGTPEAWDAPEAWGEPLLDALARHRRVLAVELPGHHRRAHAGGQLVQTTGRYLPERYRLERVLADLLATLDAHGHERVDWLGYSMGGRIALAAAIVHPHRVRRLVLEGASPGLSTDEERRRRRADDEALAQMLETQGMEAFIRRWLEQPLFASQRNLPAEIRRRTRQLRLQRDPEALAAVLRGLGTGSQPSFWRRLEEVSEPALLLAGALDEKFQDLATRMAERMPNAEPRWLPDAGHAAHLEAPEDWLQSVTTFLR